MCLPVEERRPTPGREAFDRGEEALGLLAISDRECGLDPVDKSLLDRLVGDADGRRVRQRALGCCERLR